MSCKQNVRAAMALLFVCAWVAVSSAHAATVPVNIQADSMRYSPSGKEVVFEGNVRVTRQDVTISAATITIHLSGKAESGPGVAAMDPGAIQKIVAKGGVHINYQGKIGTCATATYDVRTGMLVMEGNPALEDGQNRIQGHLIRFNLKENRSEVVGGQGKRVQATFQAPEDLKAK